jgi:hypothetical protein
MLFASEQSEATSQLPLEEEAATTTIKKWVSKVVSTRGRKGLYDNKTKEAILYMFIS